MSRKSTNNYQNKINFLLNTWKEKNKNKEPETNLFFFLQETSTLIFWRFVYLPFTLNIYFLFIWLHQLQLLKDIFYIKICLKKDLVLTKIWGYFKIRDKPTIIYQDIVIFLLLKIHQMYVWWALKSPLQYCSLYIHIQPPWCFYSVSQPLIKMHWYTCTVEMTRVTGCITLEIGRQQIPHHYFCDNLIHQKKHACSNMLLCIQIVLQCLWLLAS